MKTLETLVSEFLVSLVSSPDQELLSLISQDFLYDYDFSGNPRPYNISNLHLQPECSGVSLFEDSYAANVLAILAATGKERTFNVVKTHLEQTESYYRLRGCLYFLDHEPEGFDGSASEAKSLQENPDSNWIFTPDIQAQNFYKLQKTDDLSQVDADLKDCNFEWFRSNSTVVGDEMWVVFPLSLLKNHDEFEFPEDATIKEFKYCSMSPKHITVKITIEALG